MTFVFRLQSKVNAARCKFLMTQMMTKMLTPFLVGSQDLSEHRDTGEVGNAAGSRPYESWPGEKRRNRSTAGGE